MVTKRKVVSELKKSIDLINALYDGDDPCECDGMGTCDYCSIVKTLHELDNKKVKLNNQDVHEWLKTNPTIKNRAVNDVYKDFLFWQDANGKSYINKDLFGREIKIQTKFISKPRNFLGKTVRFYI